jgi:hypothetical protein
MKMMMSAELRGRKNPAIFLRAAVEKNRAIYQADIRAGSSVEGL